MIYKVGDFVKCIEEPAYWDEVDNDINPEDLDEDCLIAEGYHPGFTSEMYDMLNEEAEVVKIHDYKPWIMLKDSNGGRWWWHMDWISRPIQSKIIMTEADNNSKYKSVILKIKKMQDTRERKGYAF